MAMIRGVRAWLLSAGRSLSNRRICFVRRIAGGLLAFFVLTGTFLILPVYAAPAPQATPVAPRASAKSRVPGATCGSGADHGLRAGTDSCRRMRVLKPSPTVRARTRDGIFPRPRVQRPGAGGAAR